MNTRIPKGEDLIEIASFLVEKGLDQNISMEIAVEDESTLNKVNEDFFYRFTEHDGQAETPPEIDNEIVINVSGIKFRYFVKTE